MKKKAEVKRTARTRGDEAMRGRILRGARRHFFADGFRGVTTDDLAREMGMSKKTLYQNFANKNSLLEAVLDEKFAEVDADLGAAVASCAEDFSGALHRLLACVQQHTDELQPAFVRDVSRSAPEVFRSIQRRRGEIVRRHFTKLLSAGQSAGLIRKDIPLALEIEILLAATQAIITPAKVMELNLSPKNAFAAVITVFLEGLITAKGRKAL